MPRFQLDWFSLAPIKFLKSLHSYAIMYVVCSLLQFWCLHNLSQYIFEFIQLSQLTLPRKNALGPINSGAYVSMKISSNEESAPMVIEQIKILRAVLELPAKQHCQFSPFGSFSWWISFLAGSSKTAPRVLIFSMAIGAENSFELISIETYMPQFTGNNKLFLDSMNSLFLIMVMDPRQWGKGYTII